MTGTRARAVLIGLIVAVIVGGPLPIPSRAADAAFTGQPWQTNFEIETTPFGTANTTIQGPTPPAGGAGVDWDNADEYLQDYGEPLDFCGNGIDPTAISGKLDDFNILAPNPVPDQVLNKGDLCQAYAGWEVVNVTGPLGVTEFHYILYGGWRRGAVPGEISVYYPLIGGPAKTDVTLIKFNYDSAGGGTTSVSQLEWDAVEETWVETALAPTTGFNSGVNAAQSPSFGEFAVDLTATGVLPSSDACDTVLSPYVFTQTGNAASAELKDIVDIPNLVISNCSQVEITKVTDPAVPDPAATFFYELDQVDGGLVQSSTPDTPPLVDFESSLAAFRGSLTVPATPTDAPTDQIGGIIAATGYRVQELTPPPPWSLQTVVCDYYDPLDLDDNLNATLKSVTITDPDVDTFAVAPPGLLPPGVTNAVECTISNQAPSLTLVKQVVNEVRGPLATPDMWLLSATGPGGLVDFGPGTAEGVSHVVTPGAYSLAETRNTSPAPPIDYEDGTVWSCIDSAGAPVPAPANQVTVGATDNITCTIANTAIPAELTLVKDVDNTAGGDSEIGDFTLTATYATPDDPGSIDGLPISGVTDAAAVTDREVKRGAFTLTETDIPGYAESWVCVDGVGTTISTSDQVFVPVQITDPLQLDITCTVTNTFATLDIDISGSAINPVGGQHTFTLTATSSTDGTNFMPLAGALLDLEFTAEPLSGLALADVTFVSNTCEAPPDGDGTGTDVNGQCTVIVNSSASGVLNVSANGFTDPGPNSSSDNVAVELENPVSANKTWLEYRVEGAVSAINLIGEPHTFTLSGTQIIGTSEIQLTQGAIINFTWSGPETPTGPTVTPSGGGFQCVVGADGTCIVTVTSDAPGSGNLSVTGIVVELPNGATPDSTTTYPLTYPNVALQAPAPVLTKTWAAFDVTVTPSAVNLIRQEHPFVIDVTQNLGAGDVPVADGTVVNYTWSGIGTPTPAASCVTDGGTCTVTVTSDTFGAGTLTINSLSDVPVDDGVTPRVIPTVTVDASGALTVPAPVEKRWVLVDVEITPGEDNLAGEPHTFTVQVSAVDGEGGFEDGGVPDAIVDASVVAVGGATLTTDGTCDTGTDANGSCTLVVTNPGSGSIVVQLDEVSLSVNGESFDIPLVETSAGLPPDQTFPIASDKVWWQYRVMLDDSSTNPLGLEHTFTATVERTDDGVTWDPVPDGAFLDHSWVDPNTVSEVDGDSTCLPGEAGTVGGTCTFIVTSTAPTTGTLTVTGIFDTWLDRNRDGNSIPEPEGDPDETAAEIVDVPASAFGTGSVVEATKTWWDFTVDVDGPAENPVGEDHTFTVTVQYSDDGAAFQPVAEGTTLTYSWTGPTDSAEDTAQSTCDPTDGPGTDASGGCTVVIASPTVPGLGTLAITGIDSTEIPDPTREISYTFTTPGAAQKTWIAYQATVSSDATNLAGEAHPFTITVQQDRGAGFVAVPDGTTVAVALSGGAAPVSDSCATGTLGGTCTIVVDSSDPGSVDVTPDDITAQLLDGTGATVPVTVEPGSEAYPTPSDATKTWVGFRLGVAPSATNLVGEPHTFTITAEYATVPVPEPDDWLPVTDGMVAFTATSTVPTPIPESTTCPTLNASGTCIITLTSDTPVTTVIEVLGLTEATVTIDGVETTFTDVNVTTAVDAVEFTTPTATKTWVAYTVTISPDAVNPVGREHEFTLTATRSDGDPVEGATIAYDWSGTEPEDPLGECTTDTEGKCIVTVDSATAGLGTLTVNTLTDGDFVVDLTEGGSIVGRDPLQEVPVEATKGWRNYRVVLSSSAMNPTGLAHTFTATVQETDVADPDDDGDWAPVTNGVTLLAESTGPGAIDPASTCRTTGTVLGTCTFVVTNDGPGELVLTVTDIASIDINGTIVTSIPLIAPAVRTKTWVAYRVLLSPPATNLVGEPHTFTATAQFSGVENPADTDWTAVPNGTTLTATSTGPGTINPASTCRTSGSTTGTCTFVVNDAGPGMLTLTVTAIAATTIGGAPYTNLALIAPASTTKTWVTVTTTTTTTTTVPPVVIAEESAVPPAATTQPFGITGGGTPLLAALALVASGALLLLLRRRRT